MRRGAALLAVTAVILGAGAGCGSARLASGVRLEGELHESTELSAAVAFDRFLLVAADEGRQVQRLERREAGAVYVAAELMAFDCDGEIDFEALARSGNTVYAIGSHSLKRSLVDRDETLSENRRRLGEVESDPCRELLFRWEVDSESGKLLGSIDRTTLIGVLRGDDILARFTGIPSKENGVDIEGLAADGDALYVGFRSPVLRGGYVPILVTSFDSPFDYELRFVDLGGLGVRDLVPVDGGFLVLAGPAGEASAAYRILFWDGADGLPGSAHSAPPLPVIGTLPEVEGASPEALTLLTHEGRCYEVLVLFDGVPGGAPRPLSICTP